jgi:hypothetical protein
LKNFLILILLFSSNVLFSQKDSSIREYHFNGNVNVSNNGFSFIPLFTLGEPATVINLSLGRDRFSFNPSLSFDLNGLKPWVFDFIWSYKLINNKKYNLTISQFLPGLYFHKISFEKNNIKQKAFSIWGSTVSTFDFFYLISNNFKFGLTFFNAFPIKKTTEQPDIARMLSIKSHIEKIKLGESITVNWSPEIYFPKVDDQSGVFAAQNISVRFKNSPISFSSSMNKAIDFGNFTGKSFDWNIGINYSFNNKFIKKRKSKL